MSPELVFEVCQIGREGAGAEGTPVAAVTRLAVDPGVYPELDRGHSSPEEDYGGLSRHRPGRGVTGLRQATFPLNGELTFEQIMYLLECHAAGSVVPTGAGADKSWEYRSDEAADTLRGLTVEEGDDLQGWRMPGSFAQDLELSFDALSVPGASPWRFAASMVARDRLANALTPALVVPGELESALGHLTQLFEDSTSVTFGSAPELSAHLISYQLRSGIGGVLRGYGGTSDVPTGRGRARRGPTFEALVKQSASSKSRIADIFLAAGSRPQERRWRIKATGTIIPTTAVAKSFTIDHRVRFIAKQIAERDGERVYRVQGECIYDSSHSTDVRYFIISAVAAL
jgi:hypothetical protein